MRFRKLRIAFSATCLIACVLLCVFWMRSYSTLDNIAGHLPFNPAVSCTSAYGRVGFGTQNVTAPWKFNYHNAVLDEKSFGGRPKEPRKWFTFQREPFATLISVPHGFFVSIAIAAGIIPWLPWRFSLRTLLIATTLVAVVLGIVVWADRQ
jgi:hypothetical protein